MHDDYANKTRRLQACSRAIVESGLGVKRNSDLIQAVVLFDGVCNLCDRSVQFILAHDPKGRFKFAPLQSEAGRRLRGDCGLATDEIDYVVLIEGGRCHVKSGAALRIAKGLSGLWPLLSVFLIVPVPLRDWVYDIIARRRYRWFGKKDACMIPTPEVSGRFLE